MILKCWLRVVLFILMATVSRVFAQDGAVAENKTPAPGSPQAAMKRFRTASDLKLDLYAAEPMVQNVVSFAFDEQGRCYVVETHRRRSSVFDIRNLQSWLDNDLSFRTVDDRIHFFQQNITKENSAAVDKLFKGGQFSDFNHDGVLDWHDMEVESERIQLLTDTNRDGHADTAVTFATGFNSIVSGVAAGILPRKNEVWFTCVPDLWKITTSGAGGGSTPVEKTRQKIDTGFGVHIAFGGHDLHGLKMGPDGRIYFSIADRGTSTNLFATLANKWPGLTAERMADAGAVFRCNPDGSELEIFATGLRNPQELAFDDFGNLFTGDNNGDGGDKARWEQIVEGGDYGWVIGWQWLPKMGPWNSEMLWGMAASNTAAYILPPVAHIASGPAGTAFYPGTGLPGRFDGHFVLCDFRGGANSYVWSFGLTPKGATFEATDLKEVVTGFLCTDVDFGPDGAIYVSDWVEGWNKTDKGRIYRLVNAESAADPAMIEARQFLAEGMSKRSNAELLNLLSHKNGHVRQEAQFELADRVITPPAKTGLSRSAAINQLATVAKSQSALVARVHAIWALDQIARSKAGDDAVASLKALLDDPEPEIRAQVAKAASESIGIPMPSVIPLLKDASPRVRFFTANSIGHWIANTKKFSGGKISTGQIENVKQLAMPELIECLRVNRDEDAFVRHGAVLALARIGDVDALVAAARDASPSVRMGACLALRRMERPEIAALLRDADIKIVLEAARAIHDMPIPAAMAQLAQLLEAPLPALDGAEAKLQSFVVRRAIDANLRLGGEMNAHLLAIFASRSKASEALKTEALETLASWSHPSGRDAIVGVWRPLPARDAVQARQALEPLMDEFKSAAPPPVRLAALQAANQLGIQGSDSFAQSTNPAVAAEVRVEALKSLAGAKDPRLPEALRICMNATNELVRIEATKLQDINAADTMQRLASIIDMGSTLERQNALAMVARKKSQEADQIVADSMDRLLAGKAERELTLDILQAAARHSNAIIAAKLQQFEKSRASGDPLAAFRETLYGGNAAEGKKVFVERQDAACFRCHKISGEGGDVGPDLAGVGQRHPREFILESIVTPNKEIAQGFETVALGLRNGTTVSGIVKSDTATELILRSGEDGLVTVKKADIQSRDRGLSAMPEGLTNILSKADIRNLIEFLSQLQ